MNDPLDLWSEARARQRQADARASLERREQQAAAHRLALGAAARPLTPADRDFYRWDRP